MAAYQVVRDFNKPAHFFTFSPQLYKPAERRLRGFLKR